MLLSKSTNGHLPKWPLEKQYSPKKQFFVLAFLVSFLVLVYYLQLDVEEKETFVKEETPVYKPTKYLIHTSKCRIPDVDPFNEDVRKFVLKEPYSKCSDLDLLTYIERNGSVVTLHVNKSLEKEYTNFGVTCCYSNISRFYHGNKSDEEIELSDCVGFTDKIQLYYPYIQVHCRNSFNSQIYENIHATPIETKKHKEQLHKYKNKTTNRPFSLLFIGIDSISKLNLVRTMPKTYNFLERSEFINLKGYNKIGDNTFPNLMAILTGRNWTQVYDHCHPKTNFVNNCDIIWDEFHKLGYMTGYAEDMCSIGTFNYGRKGFAEPPTDLYYRPYILAAEKLPVKRMCGMPFCSGPESTGERILNAAKDFSIMYKDVPNFGFFWMNSFSHDNINCASAMDDKVLQFLSDTSFNDSLNNTIVIFFSDHGFRFGDIRYTHTGWLEERLPFIYIHLPDTFKRLYPIESKYLLFNSQRLTTPYDVHMTLQHVLYMANKNFKIQPSKGCPKCQTLFKEISESRTCSEASIKQHWCTCTGHHYRSPKDKLIIDVAKYTVDKINSLIRTFTLEGKECAIYTLNKIVSGGMSEEYLNEKNETVNNILIIIKTDPKAMFEATVEASLTLPNNRFNLLGDISRIDQYGDVSYCVKDTTLKKYCHCNGGLLSRIKIIFCKTFNSCT